LTTSFPSPESARSSHGSPFKAKEPGRDAGTVANGPGVNTQIFQKFSVDIDYNETIDSNMHFAYYSLMNKC
jgi:hypothetical protein